MGGEGQPLAFLLQRKEKLSLGEAREVHDGVAELGTSIKQVVSFCQKRSRQTIEGEGREATLFGW